MKLTLVALCIVFSASTATARAQGLTGVLSGTVRDTDGQVVSGAAIALISEALGTRIATVLSNNAGDFVVPNITADVYTVQVDKASFRTLKRTGVSVGAGARIALGTLTIGQGAGTEPVVINGDRPLVESASGEKSFATPADAVARLPLAGRRYGALFGLVPGVVTSPTNPTAVPVARSSAGAVNFMFDGVPLLDLPDNRAVMRVSVEAIHGMTVAVSGYQAEYGRSSGLQVNAITRSGTNRFLGSLYDVERKSAWNANSLTNMLNGDAKPFLEERDWGFTFGGPAGRAGGLNRLFFFVAQEFQPRTAGGETVRYRFPTLLERQGDFSATTDNLGLPYRAIRDTTKPGNCTNNNTAGCFNADGVVGRIPADRLYAPGLAILNWYPLPNIENVPIAQAYNYESTLPITRLLGTQSVVRTDYQPRHDLRGSFKFFEYRQPAATIQGTLPGWNDARAANYGVRMPSAAVQWSMNATTFIEGVWGRSLVHQEGCAVSASGPTLCRSGLQTNSIANRVTAGFGELPSLFPDAALLARGTLAYDVMGRSGSPVWDGTRVQSAPAITWNGRVAPANSPPSNIGPFGDALRDARSSTLNVSVTRLMGRHTARAGYYFFKGTQWIGAGNFLGQISFQNDGNNPFDTTFPFANAAVGVFTSYQQQSRWSEGAFTATNHEAYLQDSWKLRSNLTVDYGLRFVHQVPEHDANLNASNFSPEGWQPGNAPALYGTGCSNGAPTCNNNQRRARDPLTGQILAANANVNIGTLVPASGSTANGLVIPGQDIARTNFVYPALGVAPRGSVAWKIVSNPQLVVRGGGGLYFDRAQSPSLYNVVNNPPNVRTVTVRFGQLQNLGAPGLTTEAAPAVTAVQYDMPLPASSHWNAGVQVEVPFGGLFDISYTGWHSYNAPVAVDLNRLDLGMAFDPQYADPTQAVRTPANSYVAIAPDSVRFYRGYSRIVQLQPIGSRTYHAIQVGLTRRLRDGLSFAFSDTIQIYDNERVPPRLQHNADGTVTVRDDQRIAQELFQDNHPQPQIIHASFTWDLPKFQRSGVIARSIGLLINDWNLSGVWNGQSGAAYGIGYTYLNGTGNVSLTGSPDYAGRTVLVAAPGSGCSKDRLEQFDTSVYEGPIPGSLGLESGDGYLRGCFVSSTDLSLARTIRLFGTRALQLRVDVFNAFNQAAITNRNTTMQLPNPNGPNEVLNRPFGADGLIEARSVPRGAGFAVASDFQAPRTLQVQVRLLF